MAYGGNSRPPGLWKTFKFPDDDVEAGWLLRAQVTRNNQSIIDFYYVKDIFERESFESISEDTWEECCE